VLVVVPSPNCPLRLLPQHLTAGVVLKFETRAQVKEPPALTSVAAPKRGTSVGSVMREPPDIPTWPDVLYPQQ
jgi:hypothetical protein